MEKKTPNKLCTKGMSKIFLLLHFWFLLIASWVVFFPVDIKQWGGGHRWVAPYQWCAAEAVVPWCECPVFWVQDVALLSLRLCCCSLPWPLLRAAWLLLLPDPAAWEPSGGKTLLPKPGGSELSQTLEKTLSVSVNSLAPIFSEKYRDDVFLFKIK